MSKKSCLCALLVTLTIGLSSSLAFADCSEMGSANWSQLSTQMAKAYDNGELDAALNYAKQLTLICNQSPLINYTMSEIYRKQGNEQESHSYVRKASDYLQDYPVPQQLAEKIWFRRAELELPHKAQAEALQQKLDEKENELTAQKEAFEVKYEELAAKSAEGGKASQVITKYEDDMNTLKWTGTGVAIGGAVIAIVGAGLIGVYSDKASKNWKNMKKYSEFKDSDLMKQLDASGNDLNANNRLKSNAFKNFDKNNQIVTAGFGLLIGGVGLGVAGAVTAIVSHTKLSSFRKSNEETASVTFDVSPGWMGISGTF